MRQHAATAAETLPVPRARPLPDRGALAALGLALRPMTAADFPFLRALHAEARAADFALAPGGPAARAALIEEQFALQHRHFLRTHPRGDFLVIERDGARVGRFYFARGRPDWHVIELTLLKTTRGAGLGTALLRWLQASAAASGAARLTLYVARDNPRAAALWTQLGFTDLPSAWPTHRLLGWTPATDRAARG